MQAGREPQAVVGITLSLLGFVLVVFWFRDFVAFLRLALAFALLGVGVWLVGSAFGIAWSVRLRPLLQLLHQLSTFGQARRPSPPWRCEQCGASIQQGAAFCIRCGQQLQWWRCSACGQWQVGQGQFCGFCGHPREEHKPVG